MMGPTPSTTLPRTAMARRLRSPHPALPRRRPRTTAIAPAVAVVLLGLLRSLPVQAAVKDAEFPPAQTFRTLQLAALACSRENTAASCSISLRQADALLDHPLLPASCKDVLWEIRQRSVAAPSNSISRRDRLDRSARDVTVVCRQQIKPAETKPAPPAPKPAG